VAATSLVDRAQEFSEKLRNVLNLFPGDDPLHRDNGEKDASSFLFEILVLIELLAQFAKHGPIAVTKRGNKILLARSPAKKQSKSYFTVRLGGEAFDLLSGIKIDDRVGKTQAPDFSLHDSVGDQQPCGYQNVRAIWDAKLRGETGAADDDEVTKGEFALFLLMMDVLDVPMPGDARDVIAPLGGAFEVSALISNGALPTQAESYLIEKGVAVVANFTSAATTGWPARAVHLSRRRTP
jgi:hypothetical protein